MNVDVQNLYLFTQNVCIFIGNQLEIIIFVPKNFDVKMMLYLLGILLFLLFTEKSKYLFIFFMFTLKNVFKIYTN